MNRLGCATLVAIGILLGAASSSYLRSDLGTRTARAAVADDESSQNREIIAQLKELNAQLKDMNTFLQAGKLRVYNILNPGYPPSPALQ